MKKKLFILVTTAFILLAHGATFAITPAKQSPAETIVPELPSVEINTDPISKKPTTLRPTEIFTPDKGGIDRLQGKILNGRYYAPKNVFSCLPDSFGEGKYIAQDALLNQAACVGFYSPIGNFKKAEVIFTPSLENKKLDKPDLRDAFDSFGIGILKTVDSAEGIEILVEEMVENNMLFVSISIEKMAVLRASNGKFKSSTRGYLVFQDRDKLILLSNQKVTPPGQKHTPKQHMEWLKKDILEFRKTFEFGDLPQIEGQGISDS